MPNYKYLAFSVAASWILLGGNSSATNHAGLFSIRQLFGISNVPDKIRRIDQLRGEELAACRPIVTPTGGPIMNHLLLRSHGHERIYAVS